MIKRKIFKLRLKSVLVIKLILIFFVIIINSVFLNSREVKADFKLEVEEGDTFVYEITSFDAAALNSINFEFYSDPDEGEKCCYQIYKIDEKSTHYKIRYRIWDFTDDENEFFQKYDDRGEIHVFHDPLDYEPAAAYWTVKKLHNNSDILMSIALDDVRDYLEGVPWHQNTSLYHCTLKQSFLTYDVYYRYDSDLGFLREYEIAIGDNIIFRARYCGPLSNPTENKLFFDLLPLIIVTGTVIGISIIICSIVKKKVKKKEVETKEEKPKKEKFKKLKGKKKYDIRYILDKDKKIDMD